MILKNVARKSAYHFYLLRLLDSPNITQTPHVLKMGENKPTPTGTFKILYFAYASTHTKKSEELLPAPMQLSELFEALDKKYPRMKDKVLGSCMVTVNLEYVDMDTNKGKELKAGDEVGIIPPVSSG
ncbi:hypothetical protein C7212DRAFT_360623 [Tuber magnatum]|uniref:Molybdopterin synthase sulfur carrier subunit n=1 Tax=Tuber magnatum TaxID=42249 RepID=A0A317T0Z9_9PEZI|nr:hypothetical protein C7212DRAFT_360623 [Tuber magnatum]